MESIWSESVQIKKRERLTHDIKAEVAVIGGGMAGILTAYELKRRGADVVVLEGSRIGSGQTKNTTAKITAQHGHIYSRLIEQFGREKAKQYADANIRAVEKYKNLIGRNNIDCDLEIKNSYVYSIYDDKMLIEEAEAAKSLELPAYFAENIDLPFKTAGAVCFEGQAQFNPLKFLNEISDELTIYEKTPVIEAEDNLLYCGDFVVEAKHIVFATHFPFVNMPGYYFMRMHQERSYAVAVEGAKIPDGMYINMDNERYSFRGYNNFLIIGGANHRTGENSKGGKYEKLLQMAEKFGKNVREVARWSAQDCITLDGVPYIGRYSPSKPDWYVATGFMKWGMSSSMVAADIIADIICGDENDYAEIFSPQRFNTESLPQLFRDGVKSVKGLSKEIFKMPGSLAEDMPNGHGGVVETDGFKAGVYKSDDGRVYAVDTRCPHMGCQLEWNPDERTWDCPCHGSRFDYKGNLIGNPAQENLEVLDEVVKI